MGRVEPSLLRLGKPICLGLRRLLPRPAPRRSCLRHRRRRPGKMEAVIRKSHKEEAARRKAGEEGETAGDALKVIRVHLLQDKSRRHDDVPALVLAARGCQHHLHRHREIAAIQTGLLQADAILSLGSLIHHHPRGMVQAEKPIAQAGNLVVAAGQTKKAVIETLTGEEIGRPPTVGSKMSGREVVPEAPEDGDDKF